MQEFDLHAAQCGVPVATRNGRKARIICFDRLCEAKYGHIIALVTGKTNNFEMMVNYTDDGHNIGSYDKNLDLMLDNGK